MNDYFNNYRTIFDRTLGALEVTDRNGSRVGPDAGLEGLCLLSGKVRSAGRSQYICGNGASSAIASHMAIDWSKNGRVQTRVFSDAALLSAVVNDMGVEHMYSAPLEFYAQSGDLLVTISSSGNSPNVIRAIHKARELGLDVVTLSGLKPDNASRALGNLNFYIPAKTYGLVECAHQVLLHMWLDRYMGISIWDRDGYQNMRMDEYRT